MSKVPSYYIASNLSEKQIEADVATYMGWCTPIDADAPFRLLDVDESATGADKLFDVGAAIYMQFKKSDGLKPTQTISTRKNKSRLEGIREFRHEHGLDDNLSLFFQLRAQAKNAEQLQHNVLFAYECPPVSRAIYVAPLLLNKKAYADALFDSADRFHSYPFYDWDIFRIHQDRWTSIFKSIPFLREHISIVPHERVATHEHYFSFSESGVDVAWHSPEVITREPSRLSDFVASFLDETITKEDGLVAIDTFAARIEEIANEHGHAGKFEGETAVERLLNHAKWLREAHGVRQFLLLGNAERLNEWRGRE